MLASFGHGPTVRQKTPRPGLSFKEAVLREVSAYSTVFPVPEQASAIQEGLSPRRPIQCRWKCAFGLMPRFFRKTYYLPLSPRRRDEPFILLVVQPWSAASEHRDVRLRYAAYLSPFSST